jgi:hypothetical protein
MIQLAVIPAAPARFDHHIFLEAPHGTELARYGNPGQVRLGMAHNVLVRAIRHAEGAGVAADAGAAA